MRRYKGRIVLGALLALPAAAYHYGGDVLYLACTWHANRQLKGTTW